MTITPRISNLCPPTNYMKANEMLDVLFEHYRQCGRGAVWCSLPLFLTQLNLCKLEHRQLSLAQGCTSRALSAGLVVAIALWKISIRYLLNQTSLINCLQKDYVAIIFEEWWTFLLTLKFSIYLRSSVYAFFCFFLLEWKHHAVVINVKRKCITEKA